MSKISELVSEMRELHNNVSKDNANIKSFSNKDSNKVNTVEKEQVNHPSHYQSKTGLEAIDVIEAFDLNFNLGNVIKYILRCGKKDAEIQELEKAKWYLEREISIRKVSNSC